jgi:hypothetical protein
MAHLDPRTDFRENASQRQEAAFALFTEHAERAWRELAGRTPEADEFRQFLRLLQVHRLTVDVGGTDEQFAKFMLGSVLHEPDQAKAAWDVLIERVTTLMSSRGSGIDRTGIVDALAGAGIATGEKASGRGLDFSRDDVFAVFSSALAETGQRYSSWSTVWTRRAKYRN